MLTVPPGVDGDASIGAFQVQTHSATFQNSDHDLDFLISVELLNCMGSLFHVHIALDHVLAIPACGYESDR